MSAEKTTSQKDTPEILQTLADEHRYVDSLLGIIVEQTEALGGSGAVDFDILRDSLHYMAHYPDDFHHPREDLIFDRLSRRDLSSRADVEFLLEDHEKLHRLSESLLSDIEDVRSGREHDRAALKKDLDVYVREYRKHMSFEEGKVFENARHLLTENDWALVKAEEKYVDDPLFGNRVEKDYQKLATYLGDRFELATEDVALAEILASGGMLETFSAVSIGASDAGSVVIRHARQNCEENFKAWTGSLRSPGELMRLPFRIMENNYRHLGLTLSEVFGVFEGIRAEKNEPFKDRWDYLKELIKSDRTGKSAG
jgi:hemerythrin-like domain-containing protein